MTKFCTVCNIEKEIILFSKQKSQKSGYAPMCKRCKSLKDREYRKNNLEKIKKNYREKIEEKLAYAKMYRESNRQIINEKQRVSYLCNSEKIRSKRRDYRNKNKSKLGPKAARYKKDRRTNNLNERLADNLRSRLLYAIKGKAKIGSAVRNLGISAEKLKQYLESQFKPGMTWENYGEWHIDHIVPLSKFDLSDINQFNEANNYKNLQPLWAIENFRKGNRV